MLNREFVTSCRPKISEDALLFLPISDMSIKSESTPKKRRSLQINTRRLLRNRNVHGDESFKDCEADYLKTTAGKRRASLIARATIHPATRLASVATKMETSESVQVLTNDRLLEEPKIPASSRAQELQADFSSRQRRNERLIRSNIELIDRASRVTSGRSSARTLRPRYPRTPTPETALLLSPKLSKARQQRNSTPKALEIQKGANEKISSAFSGIPRASRNSTPRSTKIETPKSSRLKSQKISKPKFNTPKKKSTTQTPKSGHKGTPKNEGTPRAKTPKGTPKSQKVPKVNLFVSVYFSTSVHILYHITYNILYHITLFDIKNNNPNFIVPTHSDTLRFG